MTEIEALGAKPNHCTYEYAYDMYGAHCADLRLSKIPSLRSGIEVNILLLLFRPYHKIMANAFKPTYMENFVTNKVNFPCPQINIIR